MSLSRYRAWDKENNRMVYTSTNDVYFELTDDGINILDMSVEAFDDVFPHLDAVLMQYTGLKDKNGVEIYGNDVIEKKGHPSYYVSFESGSFVVISTNSIQALNWEHWSLSEMLDLGFTYIGNIYENPELLENH